jgi:lipopolysaccharide/colanic/teichoic acid biosynthesis glycosyltransferase
VAKRIVDIVMAGLGLACLSPLFLGIAVLIRVSSPGPVFHRAARAGKDGKIFRLYKFRSMVVNAAKVGPGITCAGDPRVTPLGRWLRRLKLDELPQLVNVLCGEMSFVGPRPEDPRYVAQYTPEQQQVLRVRPGITSAASVRYPHEEQLLTGVDWESTYRRIILPAKLQIELDYLRRRTLWSDFLVIGQTIQVLLR